MKKTKYVFSVMVIVLLLVYSISAVGYSDLMDMLKYVSGVYTDNDVDVETADYNQDGKVTLADANSAMTYFRENGATDSLYSDFTVVLEEYAYEMAVMEDGKLERAYYIDVFSFDKNKIESVKARSVIEEDRYNDEDTPSTICEYNNYFYGSYKNKLSIARSDKNGGYYFNLLLDDYCNDISALESKDEYAEYRTIDVETEFYSLFENTFYLSDASESSDNIIRGVQLDMHTKIAIRSYDSDGNDVVKVYRLSNLPDLPQNAKLQNVSYVLANNTELRSYEKLAVLYGVYDGEVYGVNDNLNEDGEGNEETDTETSAGLAVVLEYRAYESAGIVDGKLERAYYIDIYNDGRIKSVKAKNIIPGSEYCDEDTPATIVSEYGYDEYRYDAYVNKLATAMYNKNNMYYFNLSTDNGYTDKYALRGDDVSAEYRVLCDTTNAYNFYQCNDHRYYIRNGDGTETVYITPDTKILIRSIDDDGNDIVTLFGYDNLPQIGEDIEFDDVSYILLNNINSTRYEYLSVFYGVTDSVLDIPNNDDESEEGPEEVITSAGLAVVLGDRAYASAGIVDGKLEKAYYIDIYNDGKIKSVKAKNIIPGSEYCDEDTPATIVSEYGFDEYRYDAYVNKLATAMYNKDNMYYFNLFTDNGYTDKSVLTGNDESAEYRVLCDTVNTYNFHQRNDYTYYIRNDSETETVYITPDTKILIRSVDEDGEDIVTLFDYDNLPLIKEDVEFNYVSYILTNRTSSNFRENLSMFYGVVDGELELIRIVEPDEIRVVTGHSMISNQYGKFLYFDSLIPATGVVEENAEAVTELLEEYKKGDVYTITSEGYIDNDVSPAGNAFVAGTYYDLEADFHSYNGTLGFLEVCGYDESTGYFEVCDASGEYLDEIFKITEETVVTFADKSAGGIKLIDSTVFTTRNTAYRQNDDLSEPLRVFICAQDDGSGADTYNVIFAMIVRD